MEGRSVSQRNFLGALLGGVLGIFATYYLHPMALVLGCITGMTAGWCWDEIWKAVCSTVKEGTKRTNGVGERLKAFWVSVLKDVLAWFVLSFKFAAAVLYLLAIGIARIFMWLVRRPRALANWIKADEKHQLIAVRGVATTIFAGVNSFWAVPLVVHSFIAAFRDAPHASYRLLYLIPGLFIPIFLIAIPLSVQWGDKKKDADTDRVRNLGLEYYRSHGALGSFGRELYNVFLIETVMLIVMTGTMAWLFGLGSLLLLFVIIPVSAGVGMARGLRKASASAGYWFCLGITMAVTALVAWLAYPYFGDVRVLCLSALLAGLASAGTVEAGRHLLVQLFARYPRFRSFIEQSLEKRIDAYGNWFVDIGDRTMEKFFAAFPNPL